MRSSAWFLDDDATSHWLFRLMEGMKSSLRNGMGKNQVVMSFFSELMGFCMGILDPVRSLIFPRVLVRVAFILSHEDASLARSFTGLITEMRGALA